MNIFVECHYFDEGFHGARTYIKGLYQSMINNYNHVYYLASVFPDKLEKEFGHYPNVVYLEYKCHNKYLRMLYEIPHLIRKYNIDCAHYQYFVPFFKRCKEVVTIHDVLFLDYPEYFTTKYKLVFNALFKIAAKRANLLLTVSNYSKERISFHYDIPFDTIYVTPNAVVNNFNSKSIDTSHIVNNPFILYVGRIEKRKNHLNLVKAFINSGVWSKGVSLVMAGRCTFRVKELDEYVESLPIDTKKKIVFCEPSNEELLELYKKCLFFVFPSFAEGFGIPPLEASMCEKKVICADCTAMKEFSDFGFEMFEPHDIRQLTDIIKNNYQHPVDPIILHRTKEAVEKRYNWDSIAGEFNKVLESI